MPDLLMERGEATLTPLGISKLLKKFANYKLLILDEWLMNEFTDEEQHFVFELIERRHDASSTIFCTQYRQGEWHERLGGGVHAESMIDRIVHNASWMESGNMNMREFLSSKPKVL